MIFFSFLLLFIAAIIILSFAFALNIEFIFTTIQNDMYLLFSWLSPFFNAVVRVEQYKPVLRIYLFKKEVYKKVLKKGKQKKQPSLRSSVKFEDTYMNARYGLSNPFQTAALSGMMEIASEFIDLDKVTFSPDFLPFDDYVSIDAGAKVNIGMTIVNFFKSKFKK